MSIWDSVKKAIIGAAPILGSALGGPFGGAAATTLSTILLGKPNGTPEEILPIVTDKSHESYAKLREAEIAYETICIERSAADMLDARQKDQDAQNLTGKPDPVRSFLAIAMVVGFFAVLAGIFFIPIRIDAKTIISLMLGALVGRLGDVYAFHFGSSYGSAKKTEIMAKEKQSGAIGALWGKLTK